MLIICEGMPEGSTPQRAMDVDDMWRHPDRLKGTLHYVKYRGSQHMLAGVYLQRYSPMYELGRSRPFYVPDRLRPDDRVQESADADHPRDQS